MLFGGTMAVLSFVPLAQCPVPGLNDNVQLPDWEGTMKVAHLDQPSDTNRAQARPVQSRGADTGAPQGLELRHLRYFAALVDAGSFTRAAEQMFIAQPTLSQQIRRLEEIVGTPLLQRRREGLRLTAAGTVLLDASRAVLSLVDQEVDRARQAAGLGRQRLHVAVPPRLPDALAVAATSALRATAGDDVELVWMDTALDEDFSPIRERRADVGLGWLTVSPEALPAPLEVMSLGEFEPNAWLPRQHPAAARGTISVGELALMDVIHGPRRVEPGIYDAWTRVFKATDPRFEFTDPPFRHSLQMDLAFAAAADRSTAVLTGPNVIAGSRAGLIEASRLTITSDMVPVSLEHQPLTATAALVWCGDLCRRLQQILFHTAESVTRSHENGPPDSASEVRSGKHAEV